MSAGQRAGAAEEDAQYAPAGHNVWLEAPVGQKLPAVHALQLLGAVPPVWLRKVPPAHAWGAADDSTQ